MNVPLKFVKWKRGKTARSFKIFCAQFSFFLRAVLFESKRSFLSEASYISLQSHSAYVLQVVSKSLHSVLHLIGFFVPLPEGGLCFGIQNILHGEVALGIGT